MLTLEMKQPSSYWQRLVAKDHRREDVLNRSFFVFISAIAIYTAAVFMQDEHKIASVPEMKATVSEKEPAPPKSAVPEIQTRNPSQTL